MQQTTRSIPRNQKIILQCLAAVIVLAVFFRFSTRSKDHYLSTDLVQYSVDPAEDEVRLGRDEARSICGNNGFSFYQQERRKVYDLIVFTSELDWLEIRLRTMSPFVDYFVIVESHTAVTGEPKPVHLQDNWDLFRDHHDKIIHRVVYDHTASDKISDREEHLRNAMFLDVFPGLGGTRYEAHDGDVLIVSDVNEIVRPGAMLLLRYCDIPTRLTLGVDTYSYSFQWRRKGPQWMHPDVTIYKGSDTILPSNVRQGPKKGDWATRASLQRWQSRAVLWDAGWYCSSCLNSIAEVRSEMDRFQDQSLNTAENRDAQTIIDRVRNGNDLYGRPSEMYERVDGNQDVPEFVLAANRAMMRFRNILDRDGEDAGFEDWESAPRNG